MNFEEAFAEMRKLELTWEQVALVETYLNEARLYHYEGIVNLNDQELRAKMNLMRIKVAQDHVGPWKNMLERLQHEIDRRSLGRGTWPVGQKTFVKKETH
jgi:hypothetical protein